MTGELINHHPPLSIPLWMHSHHVQNNGKGGYAWGPKMYYYAGSQLMVEWTNQHGCGPDSKQRNVHCELVLQYTCGDQIRDGLTTGTALTLCGPSVHHHYRSCVMIKHAGVVPHHVHRACACVMHAHCRVDPG
jgi:hypothetical protein